MVFPDKAMNQLQVLDDGLRQALERILWCSVTERSWLLASLPLPALRFRGFGLCSSVCASPAAFLVIATAPSLLHHLLNKYRIATGGCDPLLISGMSIVCDHLKHFLPSCTPTDSSQHSLQASTIHDHAQLNSLYTGQFTSSWLQVIPNPNLLYALSSFALSDIGRAFPFYCLYLCSCGSTLGDIFWAMVRALSIFITVMLLPVSCLNPSSTTINSENLME